MAALGAIGAGGALNGVAGLAVGGLANASSKALRMQLVGALDPMITDAGLASGLPSPSVLPTGAVVGMLDPVTQPLVGELSMPTEIIGVVG